MELAVRAGSSKEWTLRQRPECTRLITAFVIISGLRNSPDYHFCGSSSQVGGGEGLGWRGTLKDT